MSADVVDQDLVLDQVFSLPRYRTQRSFDVHSVTTRTCEIFYWRTVIFTFALGTAAGDCASVTLDSCSSAPRARLTTDNTLTAATAQIVDPFQSGDVQAAAATVIR